MGLDPAAPEWTPGRGSSHRRYARQPFLMRGPPAAPSRAPPSSRVPPSAQLIPAASQASEDLSFDEVFGDHLDSIAGLALSPRSQHDRGSNPSPIPSPGDARDRSRDRGPGSALGRSPRNLQGPSADPSRRLGSTALSPLRPPPLRAVPEASGAAGGRAPLRLDLRGGRSGGLGGGVGLLPGRRTSSESADNSPPFAPPGRLTAEQRHGGLGDVESRPAPPRRTSALSSLVSSHRRSARATAQAGGRALDAAFLADSDDEDKGGAPVKEAEEAHASIAASTSPQKGRRANAAPLGSGAAAGAASHGSSSKTGASGAGAPQAGGPDAASPATTQSSAAVPAPADVFPCLALAPAVDPDPDSSPPEPAMSVSAIPVTTHLVTEAARLAEEAGLPAANRKLGPQDFEMLRVVGQGAFGRVYQVRKRDTGEIFAMKVMRKDRIREKEHSGYVRAERDVLTAIDHPYVVALRYSFQTARKLYLVLDFINGGHLFFQLYKAGTFNELRARLYVAEIVCAVTHLHEIGVVHRDLKPENVLLDSEGHVKITDFGLAKPGMADDSARSNSFIGTLEYMAPEVISGSGHGKGVDWWAVGVLLYEMLCGLPPFRGKSRPALQRSITTTKPKLPHFLSREAAGLIRDLLHKDPELRLGRGANGGADVKRHAFFRTISWSALEQRLVPPPFRPVVSTLESVENFDKMWTDLPAQDSPCPTPRGESLTTLNSAHFAGFTYMPPSMMPHLERRTDSSD